MNEPTSAPTPPPVAVVHQSSIIVALLSGAAAGLCTDLALFPLDTVKTRLQSAQGFVAAGGLRGIYSGLGSVAMGSMPGSGLFFCTYEGIKKLVGGRTTSQLVGVHMSAAASGEVMACLVRVPCEVIKQRAQMAPHLSSLHVLRATVAQEGIPGLYRGYVTTVLREIPFSLIQFPLWEFFKSRWEVLQGHEVMAWQSALCGCLAGGISACITTPLDVAKTRVMLAVSGSALATRGLLHALRVVFAEKGVRGLFAGVVPRVTLISVGGAIFLGAYDKCRLTLIEFGL
ncbi:hypothetical protein NP493_10g06010 [Ridgeia piscesae]|uniref:Uncharacterized protein n=1 Tax=Ridgeia piscesae TaxID=27915 RepID=A0AAD9PEZ3_RIDPI|nr:hypothetical protein NP493_10g06010 [Ridgeia piscesae]